MNTTFQRYLDNLRRQPRTPAVTAFFDLDRTLISGYSITALALERVRSGAVSPRGLLAHATIFLGWGLGRGGYHELIRGTVRALVGWTEQELVDLGQRAFERRLAASIYDEARQLIALHRACGHRTVMVTSATRYQAQPVARELGVPDLICTELGIDGGRVTGEVAPCCGESKRDAAERFAADHALALADAYFYSDSTEDLPLLEAVGRPVTANAKPALARVAEARGWTQLEFEHPGEHEIAA